MFLFAALQSIKLLQKVGKQRKAGGKGSHVRELCFRQTSNGKSEVFESCVESYDQAIDMDRKARAVDDMWPVLVRRIIRETLVGLRDLADANIGGEGCEAGTTPEDAP